MTKKYLIADVGGTNTRVAIANDGDLQRSTIKRFRNAEQSGITDILKSYLQEYHPDLRPDAVCIDIAGPVEGDQGSLTNLSWHVSTQQLCEKTGASYGSIINDMQAQGLALSQLSKNSFFPIIDANSSKGARLVVNVGTGFNSAVVLGTGQTLQVPGSETGHIDLPAPTEQLFGLHRFLTMKFGFASVEEVLSGRGLGHVYEYLTGGRRTTSKHILTHLDTDPQAKEALGLFMNAFGLVCGNLALTHLPFGGIFLVGGMAQALIDHYADSSFTQSLQSKGRFSNFMKQFSVYLVCDDHAALQGCIAQLQLVPDGSA